MIAGLAKPSVLRYPTQHFVSFETTRGKVPSIG